MIQPKNLTAIAAALRGATFRFLGVRPANGQDLADEPCVVLGEPTLIALDMAVREAFAMWPDATDWELIASDLELERSAESDPRQFAAHPEAIMSPRGRILRNPVQLAAFRMAAK